jgi:hypothetical protein
MAKTARHNGWKVKCGFFFFVVGLMGGCSDGQLFQSAHPEIRPIDRSGEGIGRGKNAAPESAASPSPARPIGGSSAIGGAAPTVGSIPPGLKIPSDRSADGTMDPMTVTAGLLYGYTLMVQDTMDGREVISLRTMSEASWAAKETGDGVIWARAGLRGSQIIKIDEQDVTGLPSRDSLDLIWSGPEPVRLVVRRGHGPEIAVEGLTHRKGLP